MDPRIQAYQSGYQNGYQESYCTMYALAYNLAYHQAFDRGYNAYLLRQVLLLEEKEECKIVSHQEIKGTREDEIYLDGQVEGLCDGIIDALGEARKEASQKGYQDGYAQAELIHFDSCLVSYHSKR